MEPRRGAIPLPGAASRAQWRAVARTVGKLRVWQDGDRERVCLEFWQAGQRHRIFSDVDRWGRRVALTRETAADLLEDIRAEVRKRRSIADALAPFLGGRAPDNLFPARWRKYIAQKTREATEGRITRGHLRELVGIERRGYLGGLAEVSIFDLGYGELEDWLAWLAQAKPGIGARTRRHALTAVVSCLHWLKRRGDLEAVPDAPEIPVDEHAPTLLSDETRAAILGAIPEAARGIFLAMAGMGLRVGEARALEVSAYRDGQLMVDAAPTDNRTEAPSKGTKTRVVRRLPVPGPVAAWIEAHVPADVRLRGGPLFCNPRGKTASKRWSPSALNRTWDRACLAACGARVAPMYEGTRHSFATLALNAGAPLHSVQKFLGHTEQRTTERYAKLADRALLDVIRPRQLPGK